MTRLHRVRSVSPLTSRRLSSQRLIGPGFRSVADAVSWLGVVQAQDYSLAKWALGTRTPDATDDEVERAFADGAILRTHVLRPTWHFVAPADIRWLLALTAPRVHRINAGRYRQLEFEPSVLRRSDALLARALRGRRFRDRAELRALFGKAGIRTEGETRLSYLLMHAELEGVVCSGPRRGKQFTYALLDERVPAARPIDRRDALVELTRRFYLSRGPATAHDFAKWSGLTLADARLGLEGARRALESEVFEGKTYWSSPKAARPRPTRMPVAHLLSIYDEYISGYKDRSAIIDAAHAARLGAMGAALSAIVIVDGRVVGTWKRRVARENVVLSVDFFDALPGRSRRAVVAATQKYGNFVSMPVAVELLRART